MVGNDVGKAVVGKEVGCGLVKPVGCAVLGCAVVGYAVVGYAVVGKLVGAAVRVPQSKQSDP